MLQKVRFTNNNNKDNMSVVIDKEYILEELKLVKEYRDADVYVSLINTAVVIRSKSTYITIEEFKLIFNDVYNIIKINNLTKTIFDKRSLKIFHQPSMEWYFTDWKDRLFEIGVKKHIKILPNDYVFRSSVKVGRLKIDQNYPLAKYNNTEILYFEDISSSLLG